MKSYIVERNGHKYYFNFGNNSAMKREEEGVKLEVWFTRTEWSGRQGDDNDKWCCINTYNYIDRKGYLSLLFDRRPAEVCREYIKKLGFSIIECGINRKIYGIVSEVKPEIIKLDNELNREEEK